VRSEFGALLAVAVIDDVVRQAARELDGQVSRGSAAELLHRLVVYRLTALTEAGGANVP
jgi:hypothetical protein